MTKKHFIAIAQIIKENGYGDGNYDAVQSQIAYGLAKYFKEQNALFDESRFIEACGLVDNSLTV